MSNVRRFVEPPSLSSPIDPPGGQGIRDQITLDMERVLQTQGGLISLPLPNNRQWGGRIKVWSRRGLSLEFIEIAAEREGQKWDSTVRKRAQRFVWEDKMEAQWKRRMEDIWQTLGCQISIPDHADEEWVSTINACYYLRFNVAFVEDIARRQGRHWSQGTRNEAKRLEYEFHKPTIVNEYLTKQKSIALVCKMMLEERGTTISERTLPERLKEWNVPIRSLDETRNSLPTTPFTEVDTPSSYQANHLLTYNGGAARRAAPLSPDDIEPGAMSTFATRENDLGSKMPVAPRTSHLVEHTNSKTMHVDPANPESETDYRTASQAQDDIGGAEEVQFMAQGGGGAFEDAMYYTELDADRETRNLDPETNTSDLEIRQKQIQSLITEKQEEMQLSHDNYARLATEVNALEEELRRMSLGDSAYGTNSWTGSRQMIDGLPTYKRHRTWDDPEIAHDPAVTETLRNMM